MNDDCQHYRIDNTTRRCAECDAAMIGITFEAESVLSAPNMAACSNPACKEALAAGTYDENNPPAGCTNPSGTYVAGRAVSVIVGYQPDYECDRCWTNGDTVYTSEGVTYGCGCVHRGDLIRGGRN